jgi:hypothetical protein
MMMRTLLCLAMAFAIWLNPSSAAEMSDADILVERLLWATGGRLAWTAVESTVVYSQQYRRDDPTSVGAVVTTDYKQARVRIDTTGRDLQQVRVIDNGSDRAWRLNRAGPPEKVSEDSLARDLRHYTGHVYRTLQRIAIRDPQLKFAVGRKGSLEVYEGSTRLAWYSLDARGEPFAMGAYDDDVGVVCGPWELEKRGIRYPAWVARPDGSWRATLHSLAVNVRLDEELFAQPLADEQ